MTFASRKIRLSSTSVAWLPSCACSGRDDQLARLPVMCDDTRPASIDERGSARSVRRIDAKEHSHNSHAWPERYLTL
ncbi:hypothetical protein LGM89_34505 [Burkholderia sp. AU31624]|uniref:hypothetical protein n=1 Tax=Burkholderia sp. AU31624 TaxID=2879629 RepID=UPI001CF5F700|nr:hypothetical protein [Burkholderia sp. AU31624]MCA8258403.1 hypothetical protein [Burkholderia sp. AU31624]